MATGLSVVLPAYNEEQNIANMVEDCLTYLNRLEDQFEIIIVNDGSSDRTGEIAETLAQQWETVRVINFTENQGYGRALAKGFALARYEYLFFTDSDRQFKLAALDVMFPIAKTGVVDLIIGYRQQRQDARFRKFLSWGYNTLANFLFDLNVKDIDCAFKIFRKEIFSKIEIESQSFFVNTEILAKARLLNYNILEVGVPHFPREAGQSSVRLVHIPLTIRELLRIRKSIKKLSSRI